MIKLTDHELLALHDHAGDVPKIDKHVQAAADFATALRGGEADIEDARQALHEAHVLWTTACQRMVRAVVDKHEGRVHRLVEGRQAGVPLVEPRAGGEHREQFRPRIAVARRVGAPQGASGGPAPHAVLVAAPNGEVVAVVVPPPHPVVEHEHPVVRPRHRARGLMDEGWTAPVGVRARWLTGPHGPHSVEHALVHVVGDGTGYTSQHPVIGRVVGCSGSEYEARRSEFEAIEATAVQAGYVIERTMAQIMRDHAPTTVNGVPATSNSTEAP